MDSRCDVCAPKKRSHHEKPVERNLSREGIIDLAFRAICLLNGLQVSGKQGVLGGLLLKLVWLGLSTLYAVTFILCKLREFRDENHELSLTRIVREINLFGFILTSLYGWFVFLTKQERIVRLLRTGNRRMIDLAMPCISMSPYILLAAISCDWTASPVTVIQRVGLIHCMVIGAGFFLVYTDILENNRALFQEISRSVDELELSSVAEKKWLARDQIQKTNDLFAWILSAFLVQIPTTIALTFTDLLRGVNFNAFGPYGFLGLFTLTLQLFELARRSTACVSLRRETSMGFARIAETTDVICAACQSKFIRILEFSEECDSLKVGHFPLSVANFLSFLISSIACVAVILQFDFRVMGALSKMASQ